MSIGTLQSFLLWCGMINFGILAIWGLVFLFGRHLMHRAGRLFGLTDEHFDLLQYAAILFYKLCIFMFFLIPYVALRIVE